MYNSIAFIKSLDVQQIENVNIYRIDVSMQAKDFQFILAYPVGVVRLFK